MNTTARSRHAGTPAYYLGRSADSWRIALTRHRHHLQTPDAEHQHPGRSSPPRSALSEIHQRTRSRHRTTGLRPTRPAPGAASPCSFATRGTIRVV